MYSLPEHLSRFSEPHFTFNQLYSRRVIGPALEVHYLGLLVSIFISFWEPGGSVIPPMHWVRIFIAFYNLHKLLWRYSFSPAPHRGIYIYNNFNYATQSHEQGVRWLALHSNQLYPQRSSRYSFYRKLDGPSANLDTEWKNLHSTIAYDQT